MRKKSSPHPPPGIGAVDPMPFLNSGSTTPTPPSKGGAKILPPLSTHSSHLSATSIALSSYVDQVSTELTPHLF